MPTYMIDRKEQVGQRRIFVLINDDDEKDILQLSVYNHPTWNKLREGDRVSIDPEPCK